MKVGVNGTLGSTKKHWLTSMPVSPMPTTIFCPCSKPGSGFCRMRSRA